MRSRDVNLLNISGESQSLGSVDFFMTFLIPLFLNSLQVAPCAGTCVRLDSAHEVVLMWAVSVSGEYCC